MVGRWRRAIADGRSHQVAVSSERRNIHDEQSGQD
jgi:hypothetical protein